MGDRVTSDGVYSLRLSLPETSLDREQTTSVSGRKVTEAKLLGLSLKKLEDTAKAILDPRTNRGQHGVKRLVHLRTSLDGQQYEAFGKLSRLLARELDLVVEVDWLRKFWFRDPLEGENPEFSQFIGRVPVQTALYDETNKYDDFTEQYFRKFKRHPFVENTTQCVWYVASAFCTL